MRAACWLERISIHSPRMGRDPRLPPKPPLPQPFQSTLPAWGETHFPGGNAGSGTDFNPLSPHGERRSLARSERKACDFNPLSPHGERRLVMRFMATDEEFQSTLPAWGETRLNPPGERHDPISIHSPRMGRDEYGCATCAHGWNFNPLSPHGERLLSMFLSSFP